MKVEQLGLDNFGRSHRLEAEHNAASVQMLGDGIAVDPESVRQNVNRPDVCDILSDQPVDLIVRESVIRSTQRMDGTGLLFEQTSQVAFLYQGAQRLQRLA